MKTIKIGNKLIGPTAPAYIVAEMSANHGGKLEKAKAIIEAAKRAGADSVKLQTYRADTITLKSDLEDFQLPKDSPWYSSKTLYDLYEEAHTPWEWHGELFRHARKVGIEIFSAPFDETAVELLESLECPMYKIASPEINHIPLLECVAKTKKPVILSTGVATVDNIEIALETLRKNGCSDIILLKCTTSYPAPLDEANLLTLTDYPNRFSVIPGLSDHTLGSLSGIVATALGAKVIEKHFIDDRSIETADSFFSMIESEFAEFVTLIRDTEKSMGKVNYELTESAAKNKRGMRSLYVSKEISIGEMINKSNIKCVRPSFGLDPKYFSRILGKKATRTLRPGDRLTLDCIEGSDDI